MSFTVRVAFSIRGKRYKEGDEFRFDDLREIFLPGYRGRYLEGEVDSYKYFIKPIDRDDLERVSIIINKLSREKDTLYRSCGICSYSIPLTVLQKGDEYFIVYKYVRGNKIVDEDLDLEGRLRVLYDISSILRSFHKVGVFHLDLNFRNVLVVHTDRPHAVIVDIDDGRVLKGKKIFKSNIRGGETRVSCYEREEKLSSDNLTSRDLKRLDLRRYTFFVSILTYREYSKRILTDPFGPLGFLVHKKKVLKELAMAFKKYKDKIRRIPDKTELAPIASEIASKLGLSSIFLSDEKVVSEYYRVLNPDENVLGIEYEIAKAVTVGYIDGRLRFSPQEIMRKIRVIFKKGTI